MCHHFPDIRNQSALPLLSSLQRVNGKYSCAICKVIDDFLYHGNSKICLTCHSLLDIRNQNVYDLDHDLYIWPRSTVNMPIETPNTASHLTSIVILAIYLLCSPVTNLRKYCKNDLENECKDQGVVKVKE